MKSNPVAWLITHDTYIDRRIFFFADVLQKNGYSVKLFPAAYTDFTGDADPDYVVRPLDWNVVKLYGLSIEDLMDNERVLLSSIIEAQADFHTKNGKFAKTISDLRGMCKKKTSGYLLITCGDHSGYYAMLKKGGRRLIYDSRSQMVTVIVNNTVAEIAREYERAIVGADLNEIQENGFTLQGDIAVTYTQGPRGHALAAHCKSENNGIWLFNNRPPEFYRGTPIPFSGLHEDEVENTRFDFVEYRKVLYDFSPILERVRRSLKEERPDLVYVADLPTLPIGVMLKETVGCSLMVDCHEWWYKQARLWERGMEDKIKLAEKSEAELYPLCDVNITVGKYLAQDMSETYHKHFDVIYSCMSEDLSLTHTTPEDHFWERFGVPDGCHVGIFQGSMTALRNLDNLARATRWLDEDCRLAIVGGGPYEDAFLHILEKEGNPDRVVMVGWVSQSELLQYTVNADLGILPYSAMDEYFSYSVPNKLMEYFEATLPMLYDVSMKEISLVAGEHGVGVAEDLSDPEKFGRTLNDLLHDPDQLAALRDNYRNCRGKFSYKSQKAAFEEILRKNNLM